VRTDGLATFLQRIQLSTPGGGIGNYLSNHPATEDRINALHAETQKLNQKATPQTATTLMTAEEWATAREVCAGK